MAAIQSLIPAILHDLNRAVRALRMYAVRHPQVEFSVKATFSSLRGLLEVQDPLVLGVSEGALVIQGEAAAGSVASLQSFTTLLRGKNISSVQIRRGIPLEELREFLRLLCMKPEDALENGRVKADLASRLPHVRLNQMRFVSVSDEDGTGAGRTTHISEGALEVAGVLTESGIQTRADAMRIIQAMFVNLTGDGPAAGVPAARQVVDFMNSISPQLGRLEPEAATRTARHYFELLALRGIAGQGVRELRDSMLQTVASMSPQVRKALLGHTNHGDLSTTDVFRLLRNFDPKLRSSALAHDLLRQRLDPVELKRLMDLLGPTPGEYSKLCELISAQLVRSGADPKAISDGLSRLMRAQRLTGEEKIGRVGGTVLVIDPDEATPGGYSEQLAWMGYRVIRCPEGRLGWQVLEEREDLDAIVMEIRMPGISGLEILNRLMQAGREVPAVIVTREPQFETAFEVAGYPRLRYLTKPVNPEELRSAIETVRVPKKLEQKRAADRSEMKRAQEIQEKLIPTQVPEVPGYDLAFYYKPALAVGGDYIDFIPLDGNRTGIVVADVSGKNITGAMVMVMVRSVFRMLAPRCVGARQTMMVVNDQVARDIRRGMFVTAMYGILDHQSNTLELTNAGHMPPVYWTKETGARLARIPGTALGLLSGRAFEGMVREVRIPLSPGSRLMLYTDGVVEAMDTQEREFSDRSLLQVVNTCDGRTSQESVAAVVAALQRHRGAAEQNDDITMVCLSREAF